MLVVKKGTVRHSGKDYHIGEVIPTMKPADEKRLVLLGVCDKVNSEGSDSGGQKPDPDAGTQQEGEQPGININPEDAIKTGAQK